MLAIAHRTAALYVSPKQPFAPRARTTGLRDLPAVRRTCLFYAATAKALDRVGREAGFRCTHDRGPLHV